MRRFAKGVLATILVIACAVLALKGSVLVLQSGSWSQTGILSNPRVGASAAALPNGRILIAGGDPGNGPTASADSFNTDGTISAAPPMMYARSKHVSVVLQDGRILVAGGVTTGGSATNTAEIFDPIAQSWSSVALGMIEARSGATAAVLQDGRVLVAGGQNGTAISSTLEIFDPVANAFSAAGMMSTPRSQHAMAVLQDGRVLIVGGNNGTAPVASTSIFDPVAGTVSAGPALNIARYGHSATTLLNGMVVVIGGNNGNASAAQMDVTPAELFDPTAGTFTTLATNLTTPREGHLAILLPNNNTVLIAGGTSGGTAVASAELFASQESTQAVWTYGFGPTGAMITARSGAAGSANQVNVPSTKMQRNGIVAVAGGSDANGNALNTTEAYGYPTVQTDQSDYPPGSPVTITGTGFQAGETITVQLVESPLVDTHGPYTVQADANGNISDNSFVTDSHDLNIRFYLTATGQTSGFQAQNTFTDSLHYNGLTVGSQTGTATYGTGASPTYTVTAGYNGSGTDADDPINLTFVGWTGTAPTGVSTSFSPASVSNGSPDSTLTITTSGSTQAGTYTFTVKGTSVPNPGTSFTHIGTLTVNKATVTASVTANNKGYDGTTTAAIATCTLSGVLAGDAGNVTCTAASATFADKNVGTGKTVTATGITLSGSAAGNYTLSSTTATTTANITTRAITVTAATQSKNYGQTVTFDSGSTQFTSSGLQNGETIGSVTLAVSNNGGAATAPVSGSPYTITPSAATGGTFTPSNYAITYATGTLTVNAAALTVTANNDSKTYGQTKSYGAGSTAFASSGLQNSETIGSVTITASGGTAANAAVGSYNLTPSAATGGTFTASNYTITYATGTLTVNAAALTVTANNDSKTYGQTKSYGAGSTAFASSGLQNSETIGSVTITASGGTAANAAVGSYNLTPSAATGGTFTASNYTITYATGTLTVGAAALTVTASAQSKNYGQTLPFGSGSTQFTSSGLQNSETIGSVTLAVSNNGGAATAPVSGSPYTITPSAATGGTITASNYTITYVTGTLTVNAAALTVTASAQSKNYGQAVTFGSGSTQFTSTGLQNGDSIGSVTLAVSNNGGAATAPVSGSPYTITPSAATGGTFTASNYTITYATGNLTVNAATLTYTASAASRTYGAANPTFTGTVTGFLGTDTQANATTGTQTFTSPATTTSNVGSYAISGSGLTANNGNYTFVQAAANATALTITPATLTYTGNAASRPYNTANPTFTGTVTGFLGTDTQANATTGALTFTSPATTASNAGSYAINGSGLIANNGNYTFVQAAANAIALTVTKATLAFNSLSILPSSSITYGTPQVTVSGKFNAPAMFSESLTITLNGVPMTSGFSGNSNNFSATFVTSSLPVSGSPYTVTINYPGDANYNSVTDTSLMLTVTQASQTITVTTPAPATAIYNSTFTVAATGGGSGNAVTFSSGGVCTNVGATFTMTSGSGICAVKFDQAGNSNYSAATEVTESVTAHPATQTITVTTPAPGTAGYNANFTVAATASSGLTVSFSSSGVCTNVGATFTMTSGSGTCTVKFDQAGNSNYSAATQVTESVAAQPATQTITITTPAPGTAVYNANFTVAATGGGSGNAVTFASGGVCTNVGATFTMTSGSGTCTVKFDQAGNSNYSAATEVTESVTAQQATAIVSLSNLTQTYTGSPLTPTVSTSPVGLAIILSGAPDTNAGSYTVTATVNDPNYQGSATNTLVISQASASTAISSSENPSNYRDSVSFVATVSSVVGTPTGTVQFVIDGSNSGPAVNLSGGTATSQATTTLKPGQHIISAVYSGDSDFAGSTSAFLIQTVNNPLASIVVTPASPTIFVGATQQFTATGTFTDGTSAILPTGGMWAAGNSLASGVRGPMAAAGNNGTTSLLYFFGGQDGSGPENFVQTYNPATGVWGSGAAMTTPRYQGTAGAPGDGKIYVIGGWNSSLPTNVVEAYDPVANTWASKADIGHLSACSVGGAINGKIYVVTGCNAASGNVGLLDVYDPAANAWTSLAPAPNAHGAGAGGVINGKLYVVGGYNSTGSAVTATLDVFDPQANTWTTLASMPTALGELSGGVWGGKLYVVGGADSSNNLQSSVYIYDPVANLWSTGPSSLSQGRQDIGLATIDGLLYAGGGSTASVSNTNLLEVLDTDSVTWKSDTTSVATVDSNAGLATGVTPGTANISATSALFPAVTGSTLLTVQNAHTTTTVTSSLNPSTYGNAVSFTATVAPQQTGLSTPTGTVQFKIDGSNLGTPVTLTGGSATSDSTSTLTVAGSPHSIEADYIPASGSVYVGSTGTVAQTVNPASLTITASSGTMTYGGTVPTITASYSGFANGDTTASLTTQPTCSTTATSSSPVGSYPSTCSGAADPSYTINYVTGTVAVTQASLTITASSGSMTYGGTVPTVAASYSGFVNGDTAASLTTKPTCSTTATSLSPVNGSPYPTTCSGAVDTNYAISYVPGTITVNPATPTVTVTDPMPTYDGSPHSATATAVGVDGHAAVNGSFSFTYDGSGTAPTSAKSSYAVVATFTSADPNYAGATANGLLTIKQATPVVTVSGGPFTYDGTPHPATLMAIGVNFYTVPGTFVALYTPGGTTAPTNAGTYPVSATFSSADPNYTSAGAVGTIIINQAQPVFSNLSPSQTINFGVASITLSGTISAGPAAPGGESVTITISGSSQPVTINNDGTFSTTFNTHLVPASSAPYPITYNYAGDGNFKLASDSSKTLTVNRAAAQTTLSSSQNLSTLGQATVFTATVTDASSGSAGTPTGIVYFSDGSALIGSGALDGTGHATFATALLSSSMSPHAVTAIYNGDSNFTPSPASGAVSQVVGARSTSTAISPSPSTVPVGAPSTVTVKVTDTSITGPSGARGAFTPSPNGLNTARTGQSAVLLANGMVLLVGGENASSTVLASAELYDPSTGTFATVANSLNNGRTGATATLLNDGTVLILGGSSDGTAGGALTTAEIYDPVAGTFTTLAHALNTARFGHTATLLPTGKVLIAGGQNGSALNTMEVFDPSGATFTAVVNTLNVARAGATATLLYNGTILFAGGSGLSSAEIYDPNAHNSTATGNLTTDRTNHAAVLLPDGNVLLTGGTSSGNSVNTTELYNTTAGTFIAAGSMQKARNGQSATMLDNAQALVVGGSNLNDGVLASAELYTPSFDPLGTVSVTSSDSTDNVTLSPCMLQLNGTGATTCSVTDTPTQVGTGTHTLTGTYTPASDSVHTSSNGSKNLTVVKADTTTMVTSSANPSTYGQTVTFTATVSVVSSGSGTPSGTVDFKDGSVTLAPGVALSGGQATFATSALNAAAHTITAVYSGDSNFNATGTGASTATPLSQTVNPATLTVAANPQTKVYRQTDPTLTYTATGFQLTDTAATVLTGALTRAPGEAVTGSPYAINQGTLTANSNYTIHFTGSTLTITPAPASVTPNAASKTYGTADPVFTGTLSGFLAADNVTATYTRTAGETVGGSPYTISGTLAPVGVLSNYSITYNTASFTINKATASVTPAAASKTYGTADPNFTGTLTGFVASDNVTAIYTRTAGETVGASPYTISATLAPVGVLSNYSITYNTASFTINKATASVTPAAASKTYGTADPVFTGTLIGFIAADDVTATYTRTAGETVGGSPYAIIAMLAPVGVLSNYSITYNTASFNIVQASTTTSVASSLSPSNWDNVVTLTATVSDSSTNSTGAPTGTVSFYNVPTTGTTCSTLGTIVALDTEPLSLTSPYTASTSTPNLPVGTDTILACYNGDTNFFATSTGNGTTTPFAQTVIAAPIATLTPPGLSFGNQQGGTTSSAQPATLCNGPSGPSNSPCYNAPVATAALSISSINFGGTNSTYFTQTNTCANTLAVGGSCTINVKFAPPMNAAGIATGLLTVTDNNENVLGSTQSTTLVGAGTSSITSVGSLSTYALFATANGCSSVNVSGNGTVDSFDGASNSGIIGTNGNVTLSGNPVVSGAVYSPIAGTGNCSSKTMTGLSTSGKAQATGGLKTLSAPVIYPLPPAPSPAPPTTNQNISGSCGSISGCTPDGSKSVSLASGGYGNLNVSGGTTVHVKAGTYNVNSLTLTGNSILYVDSWPVVINLAGASLNSSSPAMDLSGGSMVNPSGITSNLQFYYAGSSSIKLSGGTGSYALVYAPNAAINVSGGSHFYGSMIGSTINSSGNTAIHYDAALPTINGGNYIWFSSTGLNVQGLPTTGSVKLYVTNATISFTANGTNYVLPVPNAVITFSSTATSASTTWDATSSRWSTLIPMSSINGNATIHSFFDALAYQVPANFPGGIQNATWSAAFSTSTPGVKFNWQWGAAVYSTFAASNTGLTINPLDNSDPAGTPENYKSNLIFGDTGAGYTGLYVGTAGVVPTIAPISVAPSSYDFGTVSHGTPATTAIPIVLTNNDSVSYTISTIQMTGTNPGDFVQTNNCPTSPNALAAGGSCTFTVTFTPSASGGTKETAKIVINDNANNSPQTVFLKGLGQ